LGATCLVAIPAAPAVLAAQPAGSTIPPKPFSAGTIEIDTSDLSAGEVVATASPLPGLDDAVITFASTGDADITGTDGSTTTDTLTADVIVDDGVEPADPAVAAVADASGSTVTATLRGTGTDGTMRTASDTVWVDEFEGQTLVSETGEQDLRLQRVDVLEDDGTIGAAEAEALRERVLGGGARTASAPTEAACPRNRVCLSGTIRWTDSAGGLHPVASAPVEIRDKEGASSVRVLTVKTNATGHYQATFNNNDGDGTRRDISIRVRAEGPGFRIAQRIDSAVTNNIRLGARVRNLTANNVSDNNTAFSIQAAMVRASKYVQAVNGSLFAAVPVVFPDGSGSFFDGTSLHLLQLDRWDWDVVLHEYGHYLASRLNIEDNPGGQHSFNENLSTTRGKGVGTRLAWGEGWPSFFAVSALDPVTGVPLVGDDRYQDTEDAAIDVSLEDPATLGEDNERTVMNALWDLNDANVDGQDQVSLTGNAIWDTLNAADPTRLSGAYQAFSPGQGTENVNCVFTGMNVAPAVTAPVSVDSTPPTFQWSRGNGANFTNDSFTVAFRSNSNALLFTSPATASLTYQPSQGVWDTIRSGAGTNVKVTVTGSQTSNPATGPYRSCTRAYPV
jgi:hypothetical protein